MTYSVSGGDLATFDIRAGKYVASSEAEAIEKFHAEHGQSLRILEVAKT